MILIYHIEIIEVSSNFPCGIHGSEYVEFLPFGEGREFRRKCGCLDPGCQAELGVDTLSFGGYALYLIMVLVHLFRQGLKVA